MTRMKVGITCLKLGNQRSTKSKQLRRGDLRSVACEAFEERWSKDPDLDRSKTKYNMYVGYRSGLALTAAMTEEAQAYSEQRKAEGGRALRSDAAIGWAMIIKPPIGFADSMTDADRGRFWDDTIEILVETVGKKNIRASVLQVDEGEEHMHIFGMGYNEQGKLCVDDVINPRTWDRWNHEYPQRMRERGWAIEDCEPEEQNDDQPKPKHGKSAIQYKLDKDRRRKAELDAQAERQAQEAEKQAEARRQLEDRARHNLQARMDLKAREKAIDAQATEQADLISDGRKYRAMMAAQARRDDVNSLKVTQQPTRELPHVGFEY